MVCVANIGSDRDGRPLRADRDRRRASRPGPPGPRRRADRRSGSASRRPVRSQLRHIDIEAGRQWRPVDHRRSGGPGPGRSIPLGREAFCARGQLPAGIVDPPLVEQAPEPAPRFLRGNPACGPGPVARRCSASRSRPAPRNASASAGNSGAAGIGADGRPSRRAICSLPAIRSDTWLPPYFAPPRFRCGFSLPLLPGNRPAARSRRRDLRRREPHGLGPADSPQHDVLDARIPHLLIDTQRRDISTSRKWRQLGGQPEARARDPMRPAVPAARIPAPRSAGRRPPCPSRPPRREAPSRSRSSVLDRVAQGVAEVEQHPQIPLAFVARHDLGLDPACPLDHGISRAGSSSIRRSASRSKRAKKRGVPDGRLLEGFGEATGPLAPRAANAARRCRSTRGAAGERPPPGSCPGAG